jgi:hypothetical protein
MPQGTHGKTPTVRSLLPGTQDQTIWKLERAPSIAGAYQYLTQTSEPLCPLSSVLGWTGTVGVGGEGLHVKTTHLARLLFATVSSVRQVKICAFKKTLQPAIPGSLALPAGPSSAQGNQDWSSAPSSSLNPRSEHLPFGLRTWHGHRQQHSCRDRHASLANSRTLSSENSLKTACSPNLTLAQEDALVLVFTFFRSHACCSCP